MRMVRIRPVQSMRASYPQMQEPPKPAARRSGGAARTALAHRDEHTIELTYSDALRGFLWLEDALLGEFCRQFLERLCRVVRRLLLDEVGARGNEQAVAKFLGRCRL
jgi:hypothetical protein